MFVDPVHIQQLHVYTLRDGRVCRFRPFAWPDMIALLPAFSRCRMSAPWLNVLLRSSRIATGPDGASGDDPVASVLDVLFSKRYCSLPVSGDRRDELLDANDLRCLLELAMRVSCLDGGRKQSDKLADRYENSGAEFDLDGSLALVMRVYSMDWWRVRRLTWSQLLWHVEQATLLHLRYDAPLHGVDTSKILKARERRAAMERARSRLRESDPGAERHDPRLVLSALPPGQIPPDKAEEIWHGMEQLANQPTKYDAEKVEQMQKVKSLLAG